jgi:hypothetical protein
LALMNDPFVIEQAALWGAKILASEANDVDARIQCLYRSAFGRAPFAVELAGAREFVVAQQARYASLGSGGEASSSERQAWSDLCHALLSSKEFIFIE